MSRLSEHVGRVLGDRYRLVAPIGAGASALVFLADDVSLKRQVAIKLLHEGLTGDQRFLERFRAEAQTTASLNHQHLVAVYDWGFDEVPYLVTEYLAGGSLQSMLDAGHRLTCSQALLVGLEASRALEYAHRRGLIHRDIKPSNLLFDADGRLRIADFGLARALAEASITEPVGSVIGSARYASPEQARGEQVDGKSDVYSLTLALIEAVTGQVPFAGDTVLGTLMARVDNPVEVPEELETLQAPFQQAGQVDARERPDAGEFAVLLLAAAGAMPRPEALPLAGALNTSVGYDPSPTDMGAHPAASLPEDDAESSDMGEADSLETRSWLEDTDMDADSLLPEENEPREPLFFNPVDPTIAPPELDDASDPSLPDLAEAADPNGVSAAEQHQFDHDPITSVPDGSPPGLADPIVPTHGDDLVVQQLTPEEPVAQHEYTAPEFRPQEVLPDWEAPPNDPPPTMQLGAVDPAAGAATAVVSSVEQETPGLPMSRRQERRARRRRAKSQPEGEAQMPGSGEDERDEKASLVWILTGFLLVIGLAVGVYFLWQTSDVAETEVPDLTGLTIEALGPVIGDAGWEVLRLEGREDGSVPGTIIAQSPPSGTLLAEGAQVRVTVSIGNAMVTIPQDLIGVPEDEARLRLGAVGLSVGALTRVPDEDLAVGTVVRVDEAAFEIPSGESVDLVLSLGPVPRFVPDGLVGLTVEEAEARIRDLKLEPVAQARYSYDFDLNVVMEISPAPGTEVEVGTQVGLLISRGPEPIEVPDVVGLPLGEAIDELTAARLCVGRTDGRSEPDAEVLLTEPRGGDIVTDPDDCVRIVTSEISAAEAEEGEA